MRLLKILRLRLRSLFFLAAVDRELEEELQYHLEREREAAGESSEKAGHGLQQKKEECRDMRGLNAIDNLLRDTRFAFRQLRKNPAFAATAILVFSLGIGASVAIFAFVDAALIQPLPYRNPSRLMSLFAVTPPCPTCTVSYFDFEDWKDRNTSFESMAAYRYFPYAWTGPSGAEPVTGFRVTDGFFRTLGIKPVLGRDFYPGEDLPAAPKTALLSYSAWQQRYGGKADVLGKVAILDDTQFLIIGVLPRDFEFGSSAAEFWSPLRALPNSCEIRRGCHGDHVVARLKDGVSQQAAAAELQAIAKRMQEQYPDTNRGFSAGLTPLAALMVRDIRPVLLLSLGGAALLLLIAGVNVASLLLVRSESRRREIAVRTALGASRTRIVSQFVTEGLVLVAGGSGLGLVLAYWTMHLLTRLIPQAMIARMPFLLAIGFSPRVLAFAAAVAILAALLFAFTPAVHFSAASTSESIAEGARGSSGRAWRRLGSKLVAVELATAVVLLAGAGLLGKSLYRVLHVPLGFQAEHVVTLQVAFPRSYGPDQKSIALEQELFSRIGSLPGALSMGLSNGLPVQSWDSATWIRIVGKPIQGAHNEVPEREVNSAYFTALGAKLARGRYFTTADDVSKPLIAIVNQAFARQYLPGEDPVGKQLLYERPGPQTPMEIVGVVEDVKEGELDSANHPALYVPFVHYAGSYFNILVRTSGDERPMLSALLATIHQIEPKALTKEPAKLTDVINDTETAYLHRSSAALAGGFAAMALLLSVVGLYGVVAYSVSQRTREIGVRMALGAGRGSICRLVLKEALQLTVAGIVIGLCGSLAAAALMRSLLFGVGAWDVETFVAVAAVLGISAGLASYIPARRAASVNPLESLRVE